MNDPRNLQFLPHPTNSYLQHPTMPFGGRGRELCVVGGLLVLVAWYITLRWFHTPQTEGDLPFSFLFLFPLLGCISGFAALYVCAKLDTREFSDWTFGLIDEDGTIKLAEEGVYDLERTKIFGIKRQMLHEVERRTDTGKLFKRTLRLTFHGPLDLAALAITLRWRDGLSVYHLKVFDDHAAKFFAEELTCNFRAPQIFDVEIVEPETSEALATSF